MSRTIQSPAVEIVERDLSTVANLNFGGTTFFVAGFSSKGPVDELVNISTIGEFENVFGAPTNAAERYFYHTVKPILANSTNLVVSRLPYGNDLGASYGSNYTALVYPHIILDQAEEAANKQEDVALVAQPTPAATTTANKVFVFGEPKLVTLTKDEYDEAINGGIQWENTESFDGTDAKVDMGKAALVVFNKRQTSVNSQYEGYYVAAIDNTNLDPESDYDSVRAVKSVSASFVSGATPDVTLPAERLAFSLTSLKNTSTDSLSKTIESFPNFDMSNAAHDDQIILSVVKLRKDPYSTNSVKLAPLFAEQFIGSLDAHAKKVNPAGGPQLSNFIQAQTDTDGVEVKVLVNPFVSDSAGSGWLGVDALPKHKVRFLTSALQESALDALAALRATTPSTVEADNFFAKTGIAAVTVEALAKTNLGTPVVLKNDALQAVGEFSLDDAATKVTGKIPAKLAKVAAKLENIENQRIDIIAEGGLSTIFAYTEVLGTTSTGSFSDTDFTTAEIVAGVNGFKTSNEVTDVESEILQDAFLAVYNVYQELAEKKRKDCVYIADLPRWFFIEGANRKALDKPDATFSLNAYWPLKHILETVNSSYVAIYPNWGKVYDNYSGNNVWVPFSGIASGLIANSDRVAAPWKAPAGFNRGIVSGLLDIAWNPNQNHRDLLYKLRVNAVAKFPEGIVVMAQNTMLKKESAFSSLNVRRAFLLAERATYFALRFFLFEPNTSFTRSQVRNTLKPIFEAIKNDDGFVDYLIVCDERNNTPDTIDQKELHIKILIKPTRAIEFIVAAFVGTRQSQDFSELI